MQFKVDNKHCFSIAYKDIAISTANGKNEVAFEFNNESEKTKGDVLCEMRFHVPNNEIDEYYNNKKQEAKNSESESDEEVSAAKVFNNKIIQKANIGQFAGAIVASIQDLPMLIPRGNYSLDFYGTFAKLHGKTHDYKIMFKDINKIFLLAKPD